MAVSENVNDDKAAKKRKKKRRLLIPLIVLYSITLCMAAFLFGRASGVSEYYGKLIDTTVIDSDEQATVADSQTLPITLSGNVLLPDGSPYKNGVVELRSVPGYTTTDNNGIFTFENVECGSHKISIIQNNVVLATCMFTLDGNSETTDTAYSKQSDGSYLIHLPSKNVVVEIGMVMDGDSMTISDINSGEVK